MLAASEAGARKAIGRDAMRGIGLLTLRQAGVSLVTFGGAIALSVLLSQSEFALFGFVTTVTLVAAATGDLGLGGALIKEGPSRRHLSADFALQLLFWAPICVGAAAVASVTGAYGFSSLTAILLCLALFLFALQALPTAVLEYRMAFGTITAIETAQRLVLVAVAVTLAAIDPQQWSIPLGAAVAALIGYLGVLIASRWHWPPRLGGEREPLFQGFSSDWWQVRIANQVSFAAYPLLAGLLFSAADVGLLIWALTISLIPMLFAAMAARGIFPVLARVPIERRTELYGRLFRVLLLISLPLIAALLSLAEPLTLHVLGSKWEDAIPLLRLESVTSLIGVALSPLVPLLFLTLETGTVKRLMVAATAATWLLIPLAALWFELYAVSLVTIAVTVTVLVAFDRRLRSAAGYSPLADMRAGVAALAIAAAAGVALAGLADGAASTLALVAGVSVLQLALTVLLGGWEDPRELIRYAPDRADRRPPVGSPEAPA